MIFCFFSTIVPAKIFSQPTVRYSFSYINVTRNNGGGTLEPGDIIEVHALVNLATGSTLENVYFIAPITAGTQYVPNSMKLITNEGVLLRAFSDLSGSDPGVYDPTVPGIRINIGTSIGGGTAYSGANFTANIDGGKVVGGDVPKGGYGTMGIISYQLLVTANFDDIINPTGTFYYSWSKSPGKLTRAYYTFHFTGIKIVKNQGLCTNFSSSSFSAESSFGTGNTQNRTLGVVAPGYTQTTISTGRPNDNYYAVVNNSSGTGSTDNTVPYKVSGSPRVFGAWDIVGDHTNASDEAIGNLPVSPGSTGGYMLLVNTDYNTGITYQDNIQNVCPNTYYEFSAWIRNLCGQCGADQNGITYGHDPGPGINDRYHGIMPNLTYTINGIDYYSTGNMHYTGTWQKRGFIYKTGPTETSFVMGIKNNAPGGDGNDWVLDDINLSTCYPNLMMNPNDTAEICAGYMMTVSDTIRSFFDNYGSYQWETSTDGTTWTASGSPQSKTPVLVNGLYEYHVDSILAPTAADSGHYLRVKVATSTSNLSDINCSVDRSQQVFLKVYSGKCDTLNAKILDFSGRVISGKNLLQWIVQNDNDIEKYEIEKSVDGIHFASAGVVNPKEAKDMDGYTFTDPENTSNVNYYRLKLTSQSKKALSYSKTIMLYNRTSQFKISTINPFKNNLKVNIFLPELGKVEMNLFDMYGKCLIKKSVQLGAGSSEVTFDNVSTLPSGMYILTVFHNGTEVQNKLIKSN
jgi:hypothetical protein